MHETRGVPKGNIVSEWDFAQLDQQPDQTPNISTVAVSGIVWLINSNTPEYLENISQKEKCKMIVESNTSGPRKKSSIQREKENHTRKEIYADEGKKRKM